MINLCCFLCFNYKAHTATSILHLEQFTVFCYTLYTVHYTLYTSTLYVKL